MQFAKEGDACDMIDDMDGLFRRTLDSLGRNLRRDLAKRCYILNGAGICDTVGGHSGDFGLPAIDKGCNVAKAASAIAGVSWYHPNDSTQLYYLSIILFSLFTLVCCAITTVCAGTLC